MQMHVFGKFDEIPSMILQDIKETKCYGHTFGRTDGLNDGQADGQRENSMRGYKKGFVPVNSGTNSNS